MKNHYLTFPLLVVAAAMATTHSASAQSSGLPQSFIGRVSVVSPGTVTLNGAELNFSRVNVTGTVKSSAIKPSVATEISKQKYDKERSYRVTNKTILEARFGEGNAKGYRIEWVRPNSAAAPFFEAVKGNRKNNTAEFEPLNPNSGSGFYNFSLETGWTDANGVLNNRLTGVFQGSASLTASPTSRVTSGRLAGFTEYNVLMFATQNSNESIEAIGVGSFVETPKGFTGNANVSGFNDGLPFVP